jgi:hypothetical protein
MAFTTGEDDDFDNEQEAVADADDVADDVVDDTGALDDDGDEEGEVTTAALAATPAPQAAPQAPASDDEGDDQGEVGVDEVSSARRRRGGGSLYDDAREAYGTGQKAGIEAFGLDSRDGGLTKRQQAYMRGLGAYSPEEVRKVQEIIDPKREMGSAERNLATFGAFYRYYMDRGQPDMAAMAAFRMSQYYRQTFDHYKALAGAAAEQGDVKGTVYSMLKAYEAVPNGQDLRIVKNANGDLQATWWDSETGQRMGQRVMRPQELLQWATAGAMGHGPNLGWDQLMAAAGQKPAKADKNAPSETFMKEMEKRGYPGVKPNEFNALDRADRSKNAGTKPDKNAPTEAYHTAVEDVEAGRTPSLKGLKPNELSAVRQLQKQRKEESAADKGEAGKPATASTREGIAFRGAQSEINAATDPSKVTPEQRLEIFNRWRKRQGLQPYDMDVVKEEPKGGFMDTVKSWLFGGSAASKEAPAEVAPKPAAAPAPAPGDDELPGTAFPRGTAPKMAPSTPAASGFDPKRHKPPGTVIRTPDGELLVMDAEKGWQPWMGADPGAAPAPPISR